MGVPSPVSLSPNPRGFLGSSEEEESSSLEEVSSELDED